MDGERAEAAVHAMIEYSLSLCDDVLFRTMLFECSLEESSDLIVKLKPSVELEEFLRERDPLLLFKYYRLHGMYVRAAQHMEQLAKGEEDLDIAVRIEYLNRAVSSASAACDVSATPGYPSGGVVTSMGNMGPRLQDGGIEEEYLVELEGKREVARFQLLAHQQLDLDLRDLESHRPKGIAYTESQQSSVDALSAVTVRLQKKLVGISELFNEVAMPYKVITAYLTDM